MKTCDCCGKIKETKDFCDTKCRVTYHRKGNAIVTGNAPSVTDLSEKRKKSNASVTVPEGKVRTPEKYRFTCKDEFISLETLAMLERHHGK